MNILCKFLGHKLPWYTQVGTGRKIVIPIRMRLVNQNHFLRYFLYSLDTDCRRCGEMVEIGLIEIPEGKDSSGQTAPILSLSEEEILK